MKVARSVLQWLQVWSTNNIEGVHRFLARVYRLIAEQQVSDAEPDQDQMRLLHATIKKVRLLHAARWDEGQGREGGKGAPMHLKKWLGCFPFVTLVVAILMM